MEELSQCVGGHSPELALDARLLGQAIDRFLDTLGKDDRALFLRRYWFGDSVRSLAKAFAISENAASVRLSRTRQRLKQYLYKEGLL